jgi:TonB family protein
MLKKPLPGCVRARFGALLVGCTVAVTGYAAWATQPVSVASPVLRGMTHEKGVALAHVRESRDPDMQITGPSMGPDERPDMFRVVLVRETDLRIAATDAAGPWEFLLRGTGSTDRPEAEWKLLRQGNIVAQGRQPIPANGRTALGIKAGPMPALPQIELSRLPKDGVVEYSGSTYSPPALILEPDGNWLDDDSLVAYGTSYGANGGHAVLLAHVGADGRVQRVEVERVDPPGSMSVEAATALLSNRVYVPQRVDGKAVATRVRVPVNYSRDIPERREQVVANDASAPAVDTPVPRYPADALARKIGGGVTLHLLVGVDGKVKDVRVVGSTPKGVFEEVSVEAAEKWTLQPPMQDGKAVEGWVEVPITFEPERPAASQPPGAASGTPIDLRMKLDAGDMHASPRIVSRSGETFVLRLGETATIRMRW